MQINSKRDFPVKCFNTLVFSSQCEETVIELISEMRDEAMRRIKCILQLLSCHSHQSVNESSDETRILARLSISVPIQLAKNQFAFLKVSFMMMICLS